MGNRSLGGKVSSVKDSIYFAYFNMHCLWVYLSADRNAPLSETREIRKKTLLEQDSMAIKKEDLVISGQEMHGI